LIAGNVPAVYPAALVFDFDGTLLDTETPEYEGVRRVWAEHGHDYPLGRWLPYVGTVYAAPWIDELTTLVGRPLDAGTLRARVHEHRLALLDTIIPRPGVVDLLAAAEAAGVPVAIASNAPADWIEAHLDRLVMAQHFVAIVSVDRVERPKPHPEPYLTACTLIDADPARTVGFEDSVAGLTAAVAAGLYTVAVPGPMSDGHDLGFAHEHRASLAEVTLAGLGDAVGRRAA
jgi:HAD superfamily hydrolase (TIGR01509 family)